MEKYIRLHDEYICVMGAIEKYLQKSTKGGGFSVLNDLEIEDLGSLSVLAEQYEDSIPLAPISPPESLVEMIRLKMLYKKLRQKDLAVLLGISPSMLSEVLSGKRKVNIELAKRLYETLQIKADFILQTA